MRVFVLSPGRSGSLTFAKACEHLTNFTSAHESLARSQIGRARFAYPEDHIEADNRLTWFLGELGETFDSTDVLYVHLIRDTEATARSFYKRWDSAWRGSMIQAFGHGILMTGGEWDPAARLEVCRFYVETVHANIREFTRSRASLRMNLESPKEAFRQFLDRIGAEGNADLALAEWDTAHNAS